MLMLVRWAVALHHSLVERPPLTLEQGSIVAILFSSSAARINCASHLSEVHLHKRSACIECRLDVLHALFNQVVDELRAWIPRHPSILIVSASTCTGPCCGVAAIDLAPASLAAFLLLLRLVDTLYVLLLRC